jgi:formylglycine-generating enzyme required for sulfatase activity
MPAIAEPPPRDMVWIPSCRMTMGLDESAPHTSPSHEVELEGYWIDRQPVTVAQFGAFLNETLLVEHYVEAMANPHQCGISIVGDGEYEIVKGREELRMPPGMMRNFLPKRSGSGPPEG